MIVSANAYMNRSDNVKSIPKNPMNDPMNVSPNGWLLFILNIISF